MATAGLWSSSPSRRRRKSMAAVPERNGETVDILDRLSRVIAERRSADPQTSYVAKLASKGEDAALKKVGEEAAEFIMA
ncbi:MAG: phosphoribosyl-ATP diphosphatase, partial [Casimicrobiaceae bacterium]